MSDDRKLQLMRSMTRRELLRLSSLGGFAVLVAGCGGHHHGGSSNVTTSPTPISPTPTPTATPGTTIVPVTTIAMPRSQPTGDLANQITQYSTSVDTLSAVWATTSDSLGTIQAYASSTGRATRQAASGTGTIDEFLYSTFYGYRVARATQQRIQSAIVALDDAAYLGERVTGNNSLNGTDSIHNPQWVSATLENYYHLLRVYNAITAYHQTAGIFEMAQSALAGTTYSQRVIGYAYLASMFNSWVDNLTAEVGVLVDPSWHLITNRNLSDQEITDEIGRLSTIIYQLPLGPGLFPNAVDVTRSESDTPCYMYSESAQVSSNETFLTHLWHQLTTGSIGSEQAKGQVAADSIPSIVNYFKDPLNATTPVLDIKATAVTSAVANLAAYIGGEFIDHTAKDVGDYVALRWGPTWGSVADGAYRIGASLLIAAGVVGAVFIATNASLIVAAGSVGEAAALSFSTTELTALNFGNAATALNLGITTINEIRETFKDANQRTKDIVSDAAAVQNILSYSSKFNLANVKTPAAINAKNAECDQLARAGVNRGTIATSAVSGSTVSFSDPNDNRQLLCGQPATTRAEVSTVPRTYQNMEVAAFNLLLDYAKRNPDYLEPQQSGTTLSFLRSDIALLVRRTPDVASIMVPAITSAQLLCTSPGFIPIRNITPVDLTTLGSLAVFNPLSGLSPGVGINVH